MFYFETGSPYADLAGLELSMWTRLGLNSHVPWCLTNLYEILKIGRSQQDVVMYPLLVPVLGRQRQTDPQRHGFIPTSSEFENIVFLYLFCFEAGPHCAVQAVLKLTVALWTILLSQPIKCEDYRYGPLHQVPFTRFSSLMLLTWHLWTWGRKISRLRPMWGKRSLQFQPKLEWNPSEEPT